MATLTVKQNLFITEYLACLNATQAAIAAGYSPKVAAVQGCENLRKPNIRAEINRLLEARTLGKNEVLARLTEHALGSAEDFLRVEGDEDGAIALVNFAKAKKAGKLHLVKKFKIGKDGSMSFELYSAQSALNTLAKVHGLLDGDRAEDDDEEELGDDAELTPEDLEIEAALARDAEAIRARP